jgi:hypothetical protein
VSSPAPAPTSSLALRWLRATPSLKSLALRSAYLRSELERHSIEQIAVALDVLTGLAEQADIAASAVLTSLIPTLADPDLADRVEALRHLAIERALLPLGRLVRAGPLALPAPAEIDERTLATSSTGRALTLGERRSLARRPSRAAFEKLLRDPHPLVIHNLLRNPRLTEDDVLRLAARRPAHPEVIVEILRHPEWSSRARVRMAIIQNPRCPLSIAVPLVRLLIRPELHQVVAAADVSPVVRAAAQELLERRPPVPERGDRGEPQ